MTPQNLVYQKQQYLMDEEGKKKYREMLRKLIKMMNISFQQQTELSDEQFDFLLK